MRPGAIRTATSRLLVRSRFRTSTAVVTLMMITMPLAVPLRALADPTAEELLATLPFSDAEKQQILKGELVPASAASGSEREIAVAMAFLVKRPATDVVAVFRDAGGYQGDPNVTGYGRINGEGSLDDFRGVVLKPNGQQAAQRYLKAKPGTELNLDSEEIAAFGALRAANPTDVQSRVEEQLRSLLLARYRAYRAGGLAAIAPYERGGGSRRDAGQELQLATEASPLLAKYAPLFRQVLLAYPKSKPAQLEEGFFWINFSIDDQPTIALSHRLALPLDNGGYVVADRHYYVGRSHNCVQAIGGLLPVNDGTLVFYVNRTSTDQVGGIGSSAKRAIGSRIMAKQISDTFEKLRTSGVNK